ncbi:MAG: sirohydrochlorin chelatase [Acidiferrobacterales bacterium]
MNVLILLAHGSRHSATANELAELAASVGCAVAPQPVVYAFLEIAKPSLHEALGRAVREGATTIDVLPLLLNTGNHITRDIPRLIAEARRQHHGLTIRLLAHIGAHPGFLVLVEQVACAADEHVVDS